MAKKVENLRSLLEYELKDLYSVEEMLTDALPKMAKNATNNDLKQAFQQHLDETKEQKNRLEKIAEIMDIDIEGETCEAMEGLIDEAEELLDQSANNEVTDAGLIASSQKVEHYEIASYGTARRYAEQLGLSDVEKLLRQTLDEEKNADKKLNEVALNQVNVSATEAH